MPSKAASSLTFTVFATPSPFLTQSETKRKRNGETFCCSLARARARRHPRQSPLGKYLYTSGCIFIALSDRLSAPEYRWSHLPLTVRFLPGPSSGSRMGGGGQRAWPPRRCSLPHATCSCSGTSSVGSTASARSPASSGRRAISSPGSRFSPRTPMMRCRAR